MAADIEYTDAYARLASVDILRTVLGLEIGYVDGAVFKHMPLVYNYRIRNFGGANYDVRWHISRLVSYVVATETDNTYISGPRLVDRILPQDYSDFANFMEAALADS